MIKKTFKKISNKINDFKFPSVLLKNFVKINKIEIKHVKKDTEVERQWYGGITPFLTVKEIIDASKKGYLTKVVEAENYMPIMRLRNVALVDKYPPFLTKQSKRLLDEIANIWRQNCHRSDIDPEIKLAITSLARVQSYQNLLIKSGKLAMPNSPHLRGEAFDIDASGYYQSGVPINPREDEQKEFSKAFKDINAQLDSPQFGSYKLYNPEVHLILKEVLEEMQSHDKLNFVHEYAGTTNACFHVCRNPNYLP
jgi:hypothetical protein